MALTRRQRQVLDVIQEFIDTKGYSPSLEEIGAELELSSVATVHKHVSHLVQKGFVKRAWNQNRSLEPVHQACPGGSRQDIPSRPSRPTRSSRCRPTWFAIRTTRSSCGSRETR